MKNKLTIPAICFVAAILFSCGGKKEKSTTNNQNPPVDSIKGKPEKTLINQTEASGYYVGDFEATKYDVNKKPSYSNKITISVDSINASIIYGHSIVAGNLVGFIGNVEISGSTYKVTDAKEQGTNKYNGVFNFSIDVKTKKVLGNWISNNKKMAVTECKFDLVKKEFKYDPKIELPGDLVGSEVYNPSEDPDADYTGEYEALTGSVTKFNASTTELKAKDVENMFKGDLEVLRNSIYARHGYSFQNRKMRYIFDDIDWYIPISVDVRAELTAVEKKNIDLLKRYEEHASKYYDSWGR